MLLKDLQLNKSYISYGDDSISASLISPCLKVAKRYRRSAGFFSSSVISTIIDGIVSLVRSGGKIQLITSQKLSEDDVAAIELGYSKRKEIIGNVFLLSFMDEIDKLDDNNLNILAELIASGILDIKVVVTKNSGMYHDKFGLIDDSAGNVVAFFGSSNSTASGYIRNYEKVRVVRSWIENESAFVEDENSEFDSLWSGVNPFVDTFDFREAIKGSIIQVIAKREATKGGNAVELRDYQNEAIAAWVKNGHKGFFVMATGTGKTWTAIYSAHALLQKRKAIVVICAPYKHLVQQWYEDVKLAFPDAGIIKVSSENPTWEQDIKEEIIRSHHYTNHQIIIISTIMSFGKDRFEYALSSSGSERLLIVDEAHRFSNRPGWLQEKYPFMLGLSATPYSGTNPAIGDELMAFFGGQVYILPIEAALRMGYLVPYSYHPIFVSATAEEEHAFSNVIRRMAACFVNGVLVHVDEFIKLRRLQLRIISMATEKQEQIDRILNEVTDKDHFICYCGDGRLFDDAGNELRHIQFVKRKLDEHGYRPSQFTASENMLKRMDIVDRFNDGSLTALAAIRCLDEGINIPSIKSALILSSNDSLREFVQRRGRILRKHPGKASAKIFDVVVLPSIGLSGMAKIEFRRFFEYARLATNAEELLDNLNSYLHEYNINVEEITGTAEPDVEVLDE